MNSHRRTMERHDLEREARAGSLRAQTRLQREYGITVETQKAPTTQTKRRTSS